MPLTRSPSRGLPEKDSPHQVQVCGRPNSPAREHQETNIPLVDLHPPLPSSSPESITSPNIELNQVTAMFQQQFESMRLLFSSQISSIQVMVENNNIQMRESLTSLRAEVRDEISRELNQSVIREPNQNVSTILSLNNYEQNQQPPMAPNRTGQTIQPVLESQPIIHRAKKIYPLPKFSGIPEDWPTFKESFLTTTEEFQYSDLHNIMRLRDCLEGKARETVESLLTSSKNVSDIIKTLEESYGRPEQLIRSQIEKIRSLPNVEDSDLDALIEFTHKVGTMTAFLSSVGGYHHLANPLLLSELVAKLPPNKRLSWAEKSLQLGHMPTVREFAEWLSELRKVINIVKDSLPMNSKEAKKKFACVTINDRKCPICKENCKSLSVCQTFANLPVQVKWRKCGINGCCSIHNEVLHNSKEQGKTEVVETQARSCLAEVNAKSVLFQIIPVRLYGSNRTVEIYAFIDDGANVSMIDEEVKNLLGLKGKKDVLEIQWINRQVSRESVEIVDITISGRGPDCERYNMKNVYSTDKIDLPLQKFDNKITKVECPFSSYNTVKPKMIISLAHAFLTVPIETPKMRSPSEPIETKTRLGWLVYGPVEENIKKDFVSCHLRPLNTFDEPDKFEKLESLMKEYFGIETFGIRHTEPTISPNDKRALELLRQTVKKEGDRFEAGLLWRNEFERFPNTYAMAFNRLKLVEKKMGKDAQYAEEYRIKIQEYIDKGYARILSEEEASTRNGKCFYLPYFGVKTETKKKLRLLFDAAAEVDKISLNKALLPGPDLNQPLIKVLFQFRQAPIAVCGDLKEMFHQVKIVTPDQDAQRFLWRDGDPSKPPKTYVMQRMIFGATCSPCTAQYVKNTNAAEFSEMFPRASYSVINNHYVDDYDDCFETNEEAIRVVQNIKHIHQAGGFTMHNLVTNSKTVALTLGISNDNTVHIGKDHIERILGMNWDPRLDVFLFKLQFHKVPKEVLEMKVIPTKRQLLSASMSVFDPFGFVADYMISVKILMQQAWQCGVEWDDSLPEEINEKWKKWLQNLDKVAQYAIPRYYFSIDPAVKIELHMFCDASEDSMATVAYWRVLYKEKTDVVFVAGKTSCAPIRYHSIPKLELQSAVMATRLKQTITTCHDRIKVNEVFFWSDSHTVIKWIRSDHRKYKQYVANRVSEILEDSEITDWRWCPTALNPADTATRGFSYNYEPQGRWKTGPDFLKQDEKHWPKDNLMLDIKDRSDEFLKSKFSLIIIQNVEFVNSIINRSSNYTKVIRVMGWILRFASCIRRNSTKGNELDSDEIQHAEFFLVREIQKENFQEEYSKLLEGTTIDKSSSMVSLSPYIDEQRLIRVGGRLGVDIFEPFNVSFHRRHEKRWVALFTCLTVRAIHLEIVTDLSTDAFLIALRNFINRRGIPTQIRSDNGKNFVAIKKELRNELEFLDVDHIKRSSCFWGIKWLFNTPFDPASGGAWERLIQSVKKALHVLMRDMIPKYEVFYSLLLEAENIVNSRPLTHTPVTPHDPEPLTPNHFLLGTTNSNQVPATYDPKLNSLRKQWRVAQNLKNGFWSRWIREYLPDLTRRVKWCLPTKDMNVGCLVLICDTNAPRSKWGLGRIVHLYKGKDGISRSADVRTSVGILKRPISKLALIDVEST
ncbi:uncharacterized protein LOC142230919 [Haematobia irritans]|uniref:uncharacterized protein LOC142230919 n=1 Tax=Haematobia irritans TaxID=7368 RepID=UPI003F4F9582